MSLIGQRLVGRIDRVELLPLFSVVHLGAPVVDVLLNVTFIVENDTYQLLLLATHIIHRWVEVLQCLLHAVQGLYVPQVRGVLSSFFVFGYFGKSVFAMRIK